MCGKDKQHPAKYGFTIIEVMIFLAVSGVTFVIAANFINGKEAQADFTQGMNNANSIITTIINNVANGNYPFPSGNLNCQVEPGNVLHVSTTGSQQPGCVLIGRILSPEANNSTSHYTIYSIAGCQYIAASYCASSGSQPLTLQQEYPTAVNSMAQTNSWPGGLEITKLLVINSATERPVSKLSTGAVGFYATLPQSNGSVLQSGSQAVGAIVYSGTQLSDFSSSSVGAGTWLPTDDFIVMCFDGLGANNVGSITIGGQNNGGQLITKLGIGSARASQC